jgi:hypothetical protein
MDTSGGGLLVLVEEKGASSVLCLLLAIPTVSILPHYAGFCCTSSTFYVLKDVPCKPLVSAQARVQSSKLREEGTVEIDGMVHLRTRQAALAPKNQQSKRRHTSSTLATSRIECIAHCGVPTSIVRMPQLADSIGPMVELEIDGEDIQSDQIKLS